MDPSADVGAEVWHSPYRLGEGSSWSYKGEQYTNERFIGYQYAAWNFVANQRPARRHAVTWFGVDDSSFSLHAPFYGATTRVPRAWHGGNCTGRSSCRAEFGLPGNISKFSLQAMHWVGQMVANYAYSRYNVIAPAVRARLIEMEGALFRDVQEMDAQLERMDAGPAEVEAATAFSFSTAERLHQEWLDFYGDLFATFVDGLIAKPDPDDAFSGCSKKAPPVGEGWKARIVDDAGAKYHVPSADARRLDTTDKFSLPAFGGRPPQP